MTRSTVTNERVVPVLYCDIDGTIRHGKEELGRFVNTAADVKVFDGVPELLHRYRELGWRIVGISNQGGIALGHMDRQTCKDAMAETHKQTRLAFDKILWCSHHPQASNPEMAICWCRKPKPGLIIEGALALADEHPGEIYPPHMALFVGDRAEDQGCAYNAGVPFMAAHIWRAGKHIEKLENL